MIILKYRANGVYNIISLFNAIKMRGQEKHL